MDEQQPTNAWVHAEQRYQAGQEVRGVVTRIAQFGVFAQVEPGIEGIIYAFELGDRPSAMAGFTPGQEIQLYVKNIDASRKRLELSLSDDPTPGLLDERMLPSQARRKNPSNEQTLPILRPQPDTLANDANHPGCPGCQRRVQATWKFCVYCGGSLQRRCPACGSLQPDLPDARYCCECGNPV